MTSESATPTMTELLHRISSKDAERRGKAADEVASVCASLSSDQRQVLKSALTAVRAEETDSQTQALQDATISRLAG